MSRSSILKPGDLCEVKAHSLLVLHEQKNVLMLVLSVIRSNHESKTDEVTGFIDGDVVKLIDGTFNVSVTGDHRWAYANAKRVSDASQSG